VSVLHTARDWSRMVKFSHTVFALPFALSGAALAAVEAGITARQVLWILVAMLGARNAAMGFNRLADHRLDADNPRTADRELPRGQLSRPAVWMFTAFLTALFVFASFRLNPLCGRLSPLALLIVFGYSYTKRFTWGSHIVLGLALAIAPVGGWLAVRGSFSAVAWLLGGAVLMWVAGFDTIYSCQDEEFDRGSGLYSIPLAALTGVGVLADLHPVYWAGLTVIAAILIWEHRLVRTDDLSRVGVAFFNMNGVIGVIYFASILAAVLL